MANNRPINKSKKSNTKCEHCAWWDKSSDDHIFENGAWKYPCNNNKGYKAYWNRCKAFEWKSEIKE